MNTISFFTQGFYEIRNGSIDLKILQTLPITLEGSLWLVRATMMEDHNKVHYCTDFEMATHRVRD